MRIAGDAMIGYGIEPDFTGLDSNLGQVGSNPKACAELVATMDGVVVGVVILTRSGDNAGKLTSTSIRDGEDWASAQPYSQGLPTLAERPASRDCIWRPGIS
jgi:hypothetical protein